MMQDPHPSKDILGSLSRRLMGKKIVLGITGSVAAVRSSEIARLLMRYGIEVHSVMSDEACRIIHPNLMEWSTGNPVVTSLTGGIEHVALAGNVASRVDAVLIAPATANTTGKIANGIDDTPVTTLCTTAIGQGIPMIVVPAMHQPMYDHPAVTRNIERLREMNIDVLMPIFSEGKAKLPEVEEIVFRTISHLRSDAPLRGRRCIVTAGRTVEYIDPVRVITNNSSGKMGMAVARALYLAGADVDVLYGKGTASPVPEVNIHDTETADLMMEKMNELLGSGQVDCVIAAAAVGDWKSADSAADKISTHGTDELALKLIPTPKIIDQVKKLSPDTFLVAFRALFRKTVEELRNDGVRRMQTAAADMIAVNDIGKAGSGFEVETNEMHLFDKQGNHIHIPLTDKFTAAERIVDSIITHLESV
ncbi:MAG: bifunctional phosphopantothenoylcysteine decarboxylase/phosphopantothenate--cysteine ligase CoaBC [Spirochaetota bacterium]|nr:bifunctional phosphopantothenoylcysteine decarboxylase/phosphopantothenate--cysteine ligase CoaBC [Spirochaetota bacterium]